MPKKEVDPVVIKVGRSSGKLSEYGKFSRVQVRVLRHTEGTHSFGQFQLGKAPSDASYVVKGSAVKGVFRRLQERRFDDDVVFSWLGDDESQQQAAASDTEIAQALGSSICANATPACSCRKGA